MNSNKRIKHNSEHSTICISGDVGTVSSKVVSLILKNNNIITDLSRLDSLSYLKLTNTAVNTVSQCPWLITMVAHDCGDLCYLRELNKLDDLNCQDCPALEHIQLRNVADVVIDSCGALHTLATPRALTVSARNCSMLRAFDVGDTLRRLTLINCPSVVYLPAQLALNYLELADCQNVQLTMPITCDTVVIRNCSAIKQLDIGMDIQSISIDSCVNLTIMRNVRAASCAISRCPSLIEIKSVKLAKLTIDYCDRLEEIYTGGVDHLVVYYCDRLRYLVTAASTRTVILKDCKSLDHLQTNRKTNTEQSSQSITLVGEFALEEICNLFVSELTVVSNHQILNIEAVCDLVALKVVNCSELESLGNMIIAKSFVVKSCRKLISITDIISPSSITLMHLPKLTMVGFIFAPVQALWIEGCPRLSGTFSGTCLQKLTLIGTDIISIHNLTSEVDVHVSNSKYLPDINLCTELSPKTRAEQLQAAVMQRSGAIRKIIGAIRQRQIRSMQKRLLDVMQITLCSICQDDDERIVQSNRFVSKCFHAFHDHCIYAWLNIRNSCPLCNSRVC